MLKRFLLRFLCVAIIFVAADIAIGLLEKGADPRITLAPFGVAFLLIFVVIVILPHSKDIAFYLEEKRDERKSKKNEKKLHNAGLSSGEYVMSILPEEDVTYLMANADDLPLQEKYINTLANRRRITRDQSRDLVKHIRFLHTDGSEGAFVFTHLSDSDIKKITERQDVPALQEIAIRQLVIDYTITPAQGEALLEYCRKLAGQQKGRK